MKETKEEDRRIEENIRNRKKREVKRGIERQEV